MLFIVMQCLHWMEELTCGSDVWVNTCKLRILLSIIHHQIITVATTTRTHTLPALWLRSCLQHVLSSATKHIPHRNKWLSMGFLQVLMLQGSTCVSGVLMGEFLSSCSYTAYVFTFLKFTIRLGAGCFLKLAHL